ncbi:hypothetical protein A19Y_0225 [Planktothrix agardhii NIVA-CYA 126/8]|uniref:Uncharacterized protein n=1 Tax=Planktothrix agardhii (strain NIVA-CYA 126/8) TaxID=388467 RepID=A0A073CCU3_PLAA1|nr:hypothetical protein A19Y_0225 [Planktothrix agardhii NIVA-CYA 126/8]
MSYPALGGPAKSQLVHEVDALTTAGSIVVFSLIE